MTISNNGESTTLRVGAVLHTKAGIVRFARYESGETAIEILDEDGQRQITATIALVPYGAPHPGEFGVWLKDWSENEGVPNVLEAAGIVTLTQRIYSNGHCCAQHAMLTDTARAVLINHLAAERGANADRVYREIDELTKLQVFSPDRAGALKDSLTVSVIDHCLGIGMSIQELIDLYSERAVERKSPDCHQLGAARCNAGGVVRFARHQSGEAFVELVDEHGEFQCAAMMNGMSTSDLIDLIADIAGR